MKLSGWPLVVIVSLMLGSTLRAETRPQYGGALRVSTRIAPQSLDPSGDGLADTIAGQNLARLMFDTLVRVDDRGRLQAGLATSWSAEPGNQRWQFRLRAGVRFHDDSPVTPEAIAAWLRAENPAWKVLAAPDSVTVETNAPSPGLPFELARSRNAIAKRGSGNMFVGTGPFGVKEWQPGVTLVLTAEEGYWAGRPFVDSIEITMGKSTREQLIALELGKTELVEIAPEQVRQTTAELGQVFSSAPIELMALVFARDKQSADEGTLRDALALSIDRGSIRTVVLQDTGEPTGAILPNWVSGYAFVFAAAQNLERARQERGQVSHPMTWTLGYDASDTVARVIAERIALNARDAGITLQTTAGKADIRLARITLGSTDSRIALGSVAAITGATAPKPAGSSIDDLYAAESAMLQTQRMIPLFQLPVTYGVGPTVEGWSMGPDGSWHLGEVWIGGKRP